MTRIPKKDFYLAHKNLIIKAIEELQFEEVLVPLQNEERFELVLSNNIQYNFLAIFGPWKNIQIKRDSLIKYQDGLVVENFTINNFFIETQEICKINDEIIALYLEEANNTIYSDLQVMKNIQNLDLKKLNFQYIDNLLPGHPKLIMNKGRIGWTRTDINKYSPEFSPGFQLRWLAVNRTILSKGITPNINEEDLLSQDFLKLIDKQIDRSKYFICAVHPWQWEKYISIQFLEEIANSDIIDLDICGDYFIPQSSIRTLSNSKRKSQYDIKLSLSILNTSCVRGIPSKYIQKGHFISKFMSKIISDDKFLNGKVDVLEEVAAVKLDNKYYNRLLNCSYRYKELFGCVWRQSVSSKLNENEIAIPTASLLLDTEDLTLIKSIISNSSLSPQEWTQEYFTKVIIPLYHLQVEHGLGLVSHGQNIILVLKDYIPQRLIIKDFHGDLRISTESDHLVWEYSDILNKLPPEYLIHDLITGHFITVLRYLSRVLAENKLLSENIFYSSLGSLISKYNQNQPRVNSKNNLLKNEIEKVLVNTVRFTEGYSETNSRLTPMLGESIRNPLITAMEVENG